RIATDADGGRLTETLIRSLEHRLIGQSTRAADHADAALQEDVTGHYADLALARSEHARAIGTDQTRLRAGQRPLDLDHVEHRNALGDRDDQRHLRINRLQDRIRREGRRDIDDGRRRAGLLDRLMNRIEHREAEVGRTTLPRSY